MTKVITVSNFKGGTGKTITAVHVAAGLARHGNVVFVDADTSRKDQSATMWAERVGFPFTMLAGLAGPDLHRRLPAQPAVRAADFVVIDTPPIETERAGIVRSALRAVRRGRGAVIIPLAPTAFDMEALPSMWGYLDEADPDEPEPLVGVLFTSAPPNRKTAAPIIYRQQLTDAGRWVFAQSIPFGERYAQAPVAPLPRRLGAYESVVTELLAAIESPAGHTEGRNA